MCFLRSMRSMRSMRSVTLLLLSCAAFLPAAQPSPVATGEHVEIVGGHTVVYPYPIERTFLNVLPAAYEAGFQQRINEALAAYHETFNGGKYGNAFFENEKNRYPHAFIDFVNGNRAESLKFLESDDIDGWSKPTLMVGWYPCFTIRSQTRKYFFLGQYLTPE